MKVQSDLSNEMEREMDEMIAASGVDSRFLLPTKTIVCCWRKVEWPKCYQSLNKLLERNGLHSQVQFKLFNNTKQLERNKASRRSKEKCEVGSIGDAY